MRGWYRLRSGTPFYGEIPPGVEQIDAPGPEVVPAPVRPGDDADRAVWLAFAVEATARAAAAEAAEVLASATVAELIEFVDGLGEQLVEPGEDLPSVGPEVAGVDLSADPLQVRTVTTGDLEGVAGPNLNHMASAEVDADGAIGGDVESHGG